MEKRMPIKQWLVQDCCLMRRTEVSIIYLYGWKLFEFISKTFWSDNKVIELRFNVGIVEAGNSLQFKSRI